MCAAGTGEYVSLIEAIVASPTGAHIHVRPGDYPLDDVKISTKELWIFGVDGRAEEIRLLPQAKHSLEVERPGTLGLVGISLISRRTRGGEAATTIVGLDKATETVSPDGYVATDR